MATRRYNQYAQPSFLESLINGFAQGTLIRRQMQAIELQKQQADRQNAMTAINALKTAASMPKSIRGPFVDAMAQQLQGIVSPEAFKGMTPFLEATKKGNDEDVQQLVGTFDQWMQGDPNVGMRQLQAGFANAGIDFFKGMEDFGKIRQTVEDARKQKAVQEYAQARSNQISPDQYTDETGFADPQIKAQLEAENQANLSRLQAQIDPAATIKQDQAQAMMSQFMGPGGLGGQAQPGTGPAYGSYVPQPSVSPSGPSVQMRFIQPPQQVEQAMRAVEAWGVPRDAPGFGRLVGEYGAAVGLQGEGAQNTQLKLVQDRARAYAQYLGQGRTDLPVGAALAVPNGFTSTGDPVQDAINYKAATAGAETQARETAQRNYGQLDPTTRNKLQSYESTENAHKLVGQLYKPGYVGKGFAQFLTSAQSEFQKQSIAARKGEYQGGALVGALNEFLGTVPDDQAQFYRAILDAQDQLLRARSGAQINEREFSRLAGILYKSTDEPKVFEAAYKRFGSQLDFDIKNTLKNATAAPADLLKQRQQQGPANQIGGEILKSKSGRNIVADPTSPTGYRYTE